MRTVSPMLANGPEPTIGPDEAHRSPFFPNTKSRTSMPNSLEIAAWYLRRGNLAPDSHSAIVALATPTRSATWACVKHRSPRSFLSVTASEFPKATPYRYQMKHAVSNGD